MDKQSARLAARAQRQQAAHSVGADNAARALINNFPFGDFQDAVFGGYWPINDEIDVRPLMAELHRRGHALCLPCTPKPGHPLVFRAWEPERDLVTGLYGTKEPHASSPVMTPSVIFVPMLAFTPDGGRLGYGGGYYDRTLNMLRNQGRTAASTRVVFACGVAYAAQQAPMLPLDDHDQPLDGIVTEEFFKVFV